MSQTAESLMYRLNQIAHHNGNIENKDILAAIENFEVSTRKDQDKITRRACVENILKIDEYNITRATAIYKIDTARSV